MRRSALLLAALAMTLAAAACGSPTGDPAAADDPADRASTTTAPRTTSAPRSTEAPTTTTTTVPSPTHPRPDWLGTRVLPRTADGYGEIQPTPPELADRRFATIDLLPPPTEQTFGAAASSVPDDVLARSTWSPECPVARDELRYVTLTFWGFDERVHTGELLVHADAVDAVTAGFSALFESRFPIEEMRIVRTDELDAPPTGDGNNTTAFVCRPSRGTTSWSEHAYGRAVDVNPFHNPYVKGDVVLPELASAYVDRSGTRPGMLDGDVVGGFTGAGWVWGGTWNSLKDYMHLSAAGR